MADLTPDLQVCLSCRSIAESFHSLQSLSAYCFHVILSLPGPSFPSIFMSKAVLSAPLEHFTCPYQWSLLSRMKSRSSMPSRASSSLDLVVTMSWPDIVDLSDPCPDIPLQMLEAWLCQWPSLTGWSIAFHIQELYTWPHVLKERWWEERTGSSSLNCFQEVFTHVVVESSQPLAAESIIS